MTDPQSQPAQAPSRRPRTTRRKLLLASIASLLAFAILFVVAEIGLRVFHGDPFSMHDLRRRGAGDAPVQHDGLLGYVPREGAHRSEDGTIETIDAQGFRVPTGDRPQGPPILAVGDSFAFGQEVGDDESWPAYLEKRMECPVINAGVRGYGIDQAVLRAERLLPKVKPKWVVFSFVSGDVERNEYSYLYAWKPYFAIENGALALHNTPVPDAGRPGSAIWSVVARSYAAHAVVRRVAPAWWQLEGSRRKHSDGLQVSKLLIARLQQKCKAAGVPLILVGLRGRIGQSRHVGPLLAAARERSVRTLDLTAPLTELASTEPALFRPFGHLAARGNEFVAERIAAVLRE